ncbi:unnamed protein product [Rotaria sp. Silwood2]|nr:unnamed protein product [Rotaria sp. Silwood2]CAF2988786.1 unnamed protein product [Rotaria sp. Silwood2]
MIHLNLNIFIVGLLYYILSYILDFTIAIDVALQTQKGIIYGRQTQYSTEYLGIQYAKVSRWKPPIDLVSDTFLNGTFYATSFGPCCPQRPAGIYIDRQDEQCLYLNIFTPIGVSNQSLLPVLVWIHGGGLQSGCSSQSIPTLYNGTNIIANSPQQLAIIVTINYRLGVLADMYLPALIEENSSNWPTAGNYYYLDMLSALRWINKNIRDYGGNPNNVLLFGESSGANAVVDIGALKGSLNLYQHIIAQSGGAGHYLYYSNVSDAIGVSNTVVQQMNCTSESNSLVLSCLRNSSIQNLINAYGNRQTKPIIDGYFFPFYPPLAIQNGKYNPNITMIMGNNEYEHLICFENPDMNSTDAISMINQVIGPKWSPLVINYYQLNSCSSNRNATNRCCNVIRLLLMDKFFDCSVLRIYKNLYMKYQQQQQSQKLFWYHLDCNPGICPQLSVEEGAGICAHTQEIPYVFGTISTYSSMNSYNCTWDNQTRKFSNEIISHWINTARTGEPLQSWSMYFPTAEKYFQITPYYESSAQPWNRNCSVFDQIEEEETRLMFQMNSGHYRTINKIILFYIIVFQMKSFIIN